MRIAKFSRYGAVSQIFHWTTALLVVVAFILGPEGSERHVYDAQEKLGRQVHETLGLCVFVVSILRLLWRAITPRPQLPELSPTIARAAKLVQFSLYALLFALPLTAITGIWLEGHAITLLGSIEIPSPISSNSMLGETAGELHGLLGDIIIWLAGFHAAAALYHHFFLRDEVLLSMLPRWISGRRND
ncbi:cytochrome b [Duganella sp. FT50W]|uniref:Cytochrome b n=1 Tax=Duganella lactea TaxID=2692173 RepID=A0A6L8MJ24_9BURK|nr:cytochrome b [Duganella lactea]MYM35412.1 cytochrome b [Duganella lactea]MYM82504.1 cytochrome b [Duganella lactea]